MDQLIVVDGYELGYNDQYVYEVTIKEWGDRGYAGEYGDAEDAKEYDGEEISAIVISRDPIE